MNTEQLTQVCHHLLDLLDSSPRTRRCDICDENKIGRFAFVGEGEMACEDCVRNMATLALEHAEAAC
jgi:hypothetical protein